MQRVNLWAGPMKFSLKFSLPVFRMTSWSHHKAVRQWAFIFWKLSRWHKLALLRRCIMFEQFPKQKVQKTALKLKCCLLHHTVTLEHMHRFYFIHIGLISSTIILYSLTLYKKKRGGESTTFYSPLVHTQREIYLSYKKLEDMFYQQRHLPQPHT